MRIVIGSDHAGFALKASVCDVVRGLGHDVLDIGTDNAMPVDFPDIARLLCRALRRGEADRGVFLCGSGVGACIAANKYTGIRAAVCHDTYSAHQCVEHDNVNVLCLGGLVIGTSVATEVLRVFLAARFSEEERFRRRVGKLESIENENLELMLKQR
jgi:ribose 5-phosphate isomerase B